MHGLICEIVRVLPEFSSLKTASIQVSATFSRKRGSGGLLAFVLPLKYKHGSPVEVKKRGRTVYHYAMLPYYRNGQEILYIIYFMLPRFSNLQFRDKLETVIHELYHINPACNGDLRRLPGRSYLHGNSMREFDKRISLLTDKFLQSPHGPESYRFLQWNFSQLRRKFGEVVATRIAEPKPKLLKKTSLDAHGALGPILEPSSWESGHLHP
jgi:hypothetical protein